MVIRQADGVLRIQHLYGALGLENFASRERNSASSAWQVLRLLQLQEER